MPSFITVGLTPGAGSPGSAAPNGASSLQFELAPGSRPQFASLSSSLLAPREHTMPPNLLFSLARASAGPVGETNLRVVKVKADGRCMFRSIALSLARNSGRLLGPAAEEQEADQLRLAVAEALCRSPKRRGEFGEAVMAVQAEDNLSNYCRRIVAPTFWGGEPELLVLSKMLQVPIYVYLSTQEAGRGGQGYVAIQKYGEQYSRPSKAGKRRRPVRLLFSGSNHYDALIR